MIDIDSLLAAHRTLPRDTIMSADAGRMSYSQADALQTAWQAARRDDATAARDLILHVEHDPVVTITRRADRAHLLWDADERARRGLSLADTDRGGDVTFHGPGQLVVWPLLDLRANRIGTAAYMHRLEAVVIDVLTGLGLAGAYADREMPGVWLPAASRAGSTGGAVPAAKVCAIGVRVSRGLTRHGVALNHTIDLSWFDAIVPCGLPLPVTSVAERLGTDGAVPSRDDMIAMIDRAMARAFGRYVTSSVR
ncbi:MAG: lipoyl(octanoyl) transferase LipB [Planctomycetota bacterium]